MSINVPPVYSVPTDDDRNAWDALERSRFVSRPTAQRHLSDDELRAEHDDLQDEWALLSGDLAAGDFSFYPEPIVRSGIAYYEARLRDVTREVQRRVRATVQRTDKTRTIDWQARFDAMRRADVVEALQTLGVELRKRGREWTGSCPFHEDRHPSFSVSQEKGVWVCFSCQRGGDLVAYAAMKNSSSRVEALQFLEAIITV